MMLLQTMNGTQRSAVFGLALRCVLFAVPFSSLAQNLVPNPSFELIDACPVPPDVLGYLPNQRPTDWNTYGDTPDYFNGCEPVGSAGDVPQNLFTFQNAYDGYAYTGMWSYYQSTNCCHEMIGVELTAPLTIGEIYYASFYANAAFGGDEWPILGASHLGMLFTTTPSIWTTGMPGFVFRDYAHIYSEAVVSDTVAWTLITGSFVADSAYRYLVIGNHFDNSYVSIDTIGGNDTIPGLYRAYVLVDQICVSASPDGCPLAQGMVDQEGHLLHLYPNPAKDVLVIEGLQTGLTICIGDALGREVWRGITHASELRLELASWVNGFYTVRIMNREARDSIKFVLMH